MIERIGDIQISGAARGDADGNIKPRRAAGAIVGAGHQGLARQGGYDAGGGDFANRVAARVHHIHRAVGAHGQANRIIESRPAARPVVGPLRQGQSGQVADNAGGRDLANLVVVGIGDINSAVRIHSDAVRTIKPRRVTAAVERAGHGGPSRKITHGTGRRNLADGVVESVGHIHIVIRVQGQSIRPRKSRRGADAIIGAGLVRAAGQRGGDAGG